MLACGDGIAEHTDSASSVGAVLDGAASSMIFGESRNDIPLASDVGLAVPGDDDWHFAKSPLTVAAGSAATTVSVPRDGGQFLVWTTYDGWTGNGPVVVTEWAQSTLTVSPCIDHAVTFLGGILARSSDHCFPITFQSASGEVDERQFRLDGKDC